MFDHSDSLGLSYPGDFGCPNVPPTAYKFCISPTGDYTNRWVHRIASSTPSQIPAPTNVIDTGDTDTALTWQWNNPGNQTSVQTASWAYGLSNNWQYGTLGNVNQWQQTSLYNGTHYTLEVSACNGSGCSPWSSMASPDGTTQLAFPSGLTATHDQNDAYLSWQNHTTNPPPNASLYAQWWQYGYSSQWTPVQMGNTGVQSWTHANLSAGTKYSYQTYVCTPAFGCSDSTSLDVQTQMPPPSPYVSSATASSITTAWANPASTTTGYYIARSYNYGAYSAWTPIGNVTSSTDTGLSPGTWSYVVSVCSQSVCSGPSSPASWTIPGGGASPAPASGPAATSTAPPLPARPVPPAPQVSGAKPVPAPRPATSEPMIAPTSFGVRALPEEEKMLMRRLQIGPDHSP
ncbi:MAG: hypothetical protein ACR2PL_07695 [Dehalococcoidia bacterium]